MGSQIRALPQHKTRTPWEVLDLGLIPYDQALSIQEDLWREVKNGSHHYLLLLEHLPVITMGRRTKTQHLLTTPLNLHHQSIDVYEIDRGGSTTYHGPGQLVGYIICKTSKMGGIHKLLTMILESIKEVIESFGVPCLIDFDNPGIWTAGNMKKKLAAVGMSNREGITMHGFAINIDLPLSGFNHIVPCGLPLPVSTLSMEKGELVELSDVQQTIERKILDKFNH